MKPAILMLLAPNLNFWKRSDRALLVFDLEGIQGSLQLTDRRLNVSDGFRRGGRFGEDTPDI